MNGVLAIRLVEHRARDCVLADDLRRWPHHHLRHDAEDDRRSDAQNEALHRAELRHVLLQVVARETEVARLLGDVDLHDPLEQRMDRLAAAQRRALHVIDRVLAAEHEEKKQLGKAARETDHQAARQPVERSQAGNVESAAVDELLEHQRVLRLLDRLVVGVAELGRAIR